MLGFGHGTRVFLAAGPVDFRKGFDGLSGIVNSVIEENPLSGHLFLFRNRRRDRLKILYWDGDGLVLWYKRLEKGTYEFPSDSLEGGKRPESFEITKGQLTLLLGGVEMSSARWRNRYQFPGEDQESSSQPAR